MSIYLALNLEYCSSNADRLTVRADDLLHQIHLTLSRSIGHSDSSIKMTSPADNHTSPESPNPREEGDGMDEQLSTNKAQDLDYQERYLAAFDFPDIAHGYTNEELEAQAMISQERAYRADREDRLNGGKYQRVDFFGMHYDQRYPPQDLTEDEKTLRAIFLIALDPFKWRQATPSQRDSHEKQLQVLVQHEDPAVKDMANQLTDTLREYNENLNQPDVDSKDPGPDPDPKKPGKKDPGKKPRKPRPKGGKRKFPGKGGKPEPDKRPKVDIDDKPNDLLRVDPISLTAQTAHSWLELHPSDQPCTGAKLLVFAKLPKASMMATVIAEAVRAYYEFHRLGEQPLLVRPEQFSAPLTNDPSALLNTSFADALQQIKAQSFSTKQAGMQWNSLESWFSDICNLKLQKNLVTEQPTAKQREIAMEELLTGCKLPTDRSSWRRLLLYHDVLAVLRRANLSLFVLYRTPTLNTILKSDSGDHITDTDVTIWAPTLQLVSTHIQQFVQAICYTDSDDASVALIRNPTTWHSSEERYLFSRNADTSLPTSHPPIPLLHHGFRSHTDRNKAFAISHSKNVAFALTDIQCGDFIGIMPAVIHYGGRVRSVEGITGPYGLWMEMKNTGHLGFTGIGSMPQANVVLAWDVSGPEGLGNRCIVQVLVFAVRYIPPLGKLIRFAWEG